MHFDQPEADHRPGGPRKIYPEDLVEAEQFLFGQFRPDLTLATGDYGQSYYFQAQNGKHSVLYLEDEQRFVVDYGEYLVDVSYDAINDSFRFISGNGRVINSQRESYLWDDDYDTAAVTDESNNPILVNFHNPAGAWSAQLFRDNNNDCFFVVNEFGEEYEVEPINTKAGRIFNIVSSDEDLEHEQELEFDPVGYFEEEPRLPQPFVEAPVYDHFEAPYPQMLQTESALTPKSLIALISLLSIIAASFLAASFMVNTNINWTALADNIKPPEPTVVYEPTAAPTATVATAVDSSTPVTLNGEELPFDPEQGPPVMSIVVNAAKHLNSTYGSRIHPAAGMAALWLESAGRCSVTHVEHHSSYQSIFKYGDALPYQGGVNIYWNSCLTADPNRLVLVDPNRAANQIRGATQFSVNAFQAVLNSGYKDMVDSNGNLVPFNPRSGEMFQSCINAIGATSKATEAETAQGSTHLISTSNQALGNRMIYGHGVCAMLIMLSDSAAVDGNGGNYAPASEWLTNETLITEATRDYHGRCIYTYPGNQKPTYYCRDAIALMHFFKQYPIMQDTD